MFNTNVKEVIIKNKGDSIHIQVKVDSSQKFDTGIITFQTDKRMGTNRFFGKITRKFIGNKVTFEMNKEFFLNNPLAYLFSVKLALKKGQITMSSEILSNKNIKLIGFENMRKNDINLTFFADRLVFYKLGDEAKVIQDKFLHVIQKHQNDSTSFVITTPEDEFLDVEYILPGWTKNLYNLQQRYEQGCKIYFFKDKLDIIFTSKKIIPDLDYFGTTRYPIEYHGDDIAFAIRGDINHPKEVTFIFNGNQRSRPFGLSPMNMFDEEALIKDKKLFVSVTNFSSYMSGIHNKDNGINNLSSFVKSVLEKYNISEKNATFFMPSITGVAGKELSNIFSASRFLLPVPINNIRTGMTHVYDREFYIRGMHIDPDKIFEDEVTALYDERESLLSLTLSEKFSYEAYNIDFTKMQNTNLVIGYNEHSSVARSTVNIAFLGYMNTVEDQKLSCEVSLLNNNIKATISQDILNQYGAIPGKEHCGAYIVLNFKKKQNRVYLIFDKNSLDLDLSFIKIDEEFDVELLIVNSKETKSKINTLATDIKLNTTNKEKICGEYFNVIHTSFNNGIFNILLEDKFGYPKDNDFIKYYAQIHGDVKTYTMEFKPQWNSEKLIIPNKPLEVINEEINRIVLMKEEGNVIKYQEYLNFNELEKAQTKKLT